MKKIKKQLTKDIKVYDAQTSLKEIFSHAFVNFLYSFMSGLVIASMIIGNIFVIGGAYVGLKLVEAKILNRDKYKTKFGKTILFPIPGLLGFLLAYYLKGIL